MEALNPTTFATRPVWHAERVTVRFPAPHIEVLSSPDPEVVSLLDALSAELAGGGYTASETFGYSVEQLQDRAVHLVGARTGTKLVGLGGLELQEGAIAPVWEHLVRRGQRTGAGSHRGS